MYRKFAEWLAIALLFTALILSIAAGMHKATDRSVGNLQAQDHAWRVDVTCKMKALRECEPLINAVPVDSVFGCRRAVLQECLAEANGGNQ